MSQYPYFPLYVNDILGSGRVAVMDATAFGAYTALLCRAWHETPPATLPNDDSVLQVWSKATPDQWPKVRSLVLACFTIRNGRLFNARLWREYEKLKSRSEARAYAARCKKPPNADQTQANALHTDNDNGSTPVRKSGTAVLDWSALSYSAFPIEPPNQPSYAVENNCHQLVRAGRKFSDFERIVVWRRKTKNQYAPRSPVALTDPDKWEQWLSMMAEEKPNGRSFKYCP